MLKDEWLEKTIDMDLYEQKYKEACNIAKMWHRNSALPNNVRSILEKIFPELKESEDERIRKELRIYLDWLDGRKDCAPRGDYSIRDMLAWLEKQKNLLMQPPPQQEYKVDSKKDIGKALHIYLDWLDGRNKDYQPKGKHTIKEMIDWLKEILEIN